jgi:hypothetical protein
MYWLETPALNVKEPFPILISAFAACDKKSKEAKKERIIFLFIFFLNN